MSSAPVSENKEKNREQWGSRLGYILSTVGMAFGLGAIWRFPYLTAQNGGGSFVLAFTIITIVIAVPAGMAEIAFGRKMRNGTIESFRKILGEKGKYIGWIFPLVPMCLNMFYFVVVSWTLVYTLYSLFSGTMMTDPIGFFNGFMENKTAIFAWTVVTTILIAIICLKGIKGGIEKFCLYGIPLAFLLLVVLMVRVFFLPGAMDGVIMMARPDLEQMMDPSMWSRAAGMALFAIGLGPSYLTAFGRYLPEKSNIPMDFLAVAWWNLFGCVVAGFAIVPAVVAFGLDLQSGPALTYLTLPYVFAQMPFSQIIAFMFFLTMLLAGLSSAIANLETSATTIGDSLGWSRTKAIIIVSIVIILGAIPCIWDEAFLAKFDFLVGDVGYTLTASLMACVLAWYVGAKKIRLTMLMPGSSIRIGSWFDFIYKYVACPVLLFMFIQSLMNIPKIFFH